MTEPFQRRSSLRCAGFTLMELTAVVFIITVLVSLLSAALNHTKSKALRITCLDNLKQLQQGWWVYAADNGESLPLNQTASQPADPRSPQLQSSKDSWVSGSPLQDITPDNIARGTLFPYVGSVAVYRCPSDGSTVPRDPSVLRTRSYSMDSYLGGDPGLNPPPKFKFAEINRPENAFVFIEEHENSRWYSSFLVPPPSDKGRLSAASSSVWLSIPAERHNQGCNISFADGHIEYWRWYAPKVSSDSDIRVASTSEPTVPQSRDFIRLQSCLP